MSRADSSLADHLARLARQLKNRELTDTEVRDRLFALSARDAAESNEVLEFVESETGSDGEGGLTPTSRLPGDGQPGSIPAELGLPASLSTPSPSLEREGHGADESVSLREDEAPLLGAQSGEALDASESRADCQGPRGEGLEAGSREQTGAPMADEGPRGSEPSGSARPLEEKAGEPPADGLGGESESGDEESRDSESPLPLAPLSARRYGLRERLGVGGQGEIWAVFDRLLDRTVALKVLKGRRTKKKKSLDAFMREACTTAQLDHPGVIPVYDLGRLSDGSAAYTMKRVKGRTLKRILRAPKRMEDGAPRFTRRRLLEVLLQASHAVAYAHHQGLIHRDLKPDNIMVGDYGEVFVLDWGIARPIADKPGADKADGDDITLEESGTRMGTIKGTPAYMAPEQAAGAIDRIVPATDVFALGLILFEILLEQPARKKGSPPEVIAEARKKEIPSPEARRVESSLNVPPVPEALNQLVLHCTRLDPAERPKDASAFAELLRGFLDGERQRELAEEFALEAERIEVVQRELHQEYELAKQVAEGARQSVQPWAPVEDKRTLWEAEDRVEALRREHENVLSRKVATFERALNADPDNVRARAGLARHYFERLLHAESLGRVREAADYEAQVRRLDDGRYAARLKSTGTLILTCRQGSIDVWLHPQTMVDRRLRWGEGRRLGATPLEVHDLPTGSYVAVFRRRAGHDIIYPVLIRRNSVWKGELVLYENISERFVHVPAGYAIIGGDRLAPQSLERTEVWVDDFAISKRPVSCRDYLDFLSTLSPDEAIARMPRAPSTLGGRTWWTIRDGKIVMPRVDESRGRWDARYPIRAISLRDAEAYIAWKSKRDGRPYRLPTEIEWEKAGRSVDGRHYPWGNTFDATFCVMRDSRPGRPEPAPIGIQTADRSVYGVVDMAGNISEWCSTAYNSYGLAATIKGGYWRASPNACRLARRSGAYPDEPALFAGFRLVMDLSSQKDDT